MPQSTDTKTQRRCSVLPKLGLNFLGGKIRNCGSVQESEADSVDSGESGPQSWLPG